jgi:hypothetical protein
MYVDSNQRKLNTAEIITNFLQNSPQPHPPSVMMPAILTELSQPNTKTKQIGNTLFEVILGQGREAFFKAFNADIGANFVESSKMFCVWAHRDLNLQFVVTEFSDPSLEKLFKIISMKPPLPNMAYQAFRLEDGDMRIVLKLGA